MLASTFNARVNFHFESSCHIIFRCRISKAASFEIDEVFNLLSFGVDARYEMKEEDKQIVRDHLERMLHIMHDLHSTSKIGVDFNRDYFAKRPSTVECVEWKKLHKKDLGQRFWNITSE